MNITALMHTVTFKLSQMKEFKNLFRLNTAYYRKVFFCRVTCQLGHFTFEYEEPSIKYLGSFSIILLHARTTCIPRNAVLIYII